MHPLVTHATWLNLLASTLVLADAAAQRPPSGSETNKLIKRYYALDHRAKAGHKEALEILARLDELPPLTPPEAEGWRKKLMKSWKRGKKLEKKGRAYFWKKDEKGRYVVGGKTSKPKGLLIGLHGSRRGQNTANSSFGMYQSAAKKLGWVLVCPEVLAKSEYGWTTDGTEEFVIDLIDAALRTWKIDSDHIFCTGHANGGFGSWTVGAHHADRFAALAPSAGAPTPLMNRQKKIIGIIEGVIPNLRNVQLVIFQGLDDTELTPDNNRVAVKLLGEAKAKWGRYEYEYWEVDGVGHGKPKGGAISLLKKVESATRNPVPERITWQPTLKWKRQFYWLYWDNPFVNSLMIANLDKEKNEIRIECEHARKGLQILLDDRMLDLAKEVVVIVNDTERYRGIPERRLSTLLLTSHHADPGLIFDARIVLDLPRAKY